MAKLVLTQRLAEYGMQFLKEDECRVVDKTDGMDFIDDLRWADGLLVKTGYITEDVIRACPDLKVIARHGVGYDTVDVKTATEFGIPVVNTPGANSRSVAEHTLMMLLAAAKDLVHTDAELRKGNWMVRQEFRSFEIKGKTVGLIGGGNIGRQVAEMCCGIGLKAFIYDPFLSAERCADLRKEGFGVCGSLDELAAVSDFVSIHVPCTELTRNMIDEDFFEKMKNTAVLINCARGGVVNEEALANALKNGEIYAAAIDVFAKEPYDPECVLADAPHLTITPHMAAQTEDAVNEICRMMTEGVHAVLRGERWPYVADPSVYNHPRWN